MEARVVEALEPDIVIELYSELALVTQRPFRRAEFLGPEVNVAYAAAPTLSTLDLTTQLTFDTGADRVTQRVVDGGIEITVESGVAYLALGALDVAAGAELLLGLEMSTETNGVVAFYRGDRLSRSTSVSDLLPLETNDDLDQRIVPLPAAGSGASTWMVLTSGLGKITLRSLEIRAPSARRY